MQDQAHARSGKEEWKEETKRQEKTTGVNIKLKLGSGSEISVQLC